jgi:hypothetical protein
MDLTSSHIDDTKGRWSGRTRKKIKLVREGGKILVVTDGRTVGRLGGNGEI